MVYLQKDAEEYKKHIHLARVFGISVIIIYKIIGYTHLN